MIYFIAIMRLLSDQKSNPISILKTKCIFLWRNHWKNLVIAKLARVVLHFNFIFLYKYILHWYWLPVVCGYTFFIGSDHILKDEIWGIQFGFQMAKDLNNTNLIIEFDSKVVVNLLKNTNIFSHHPYFTLIKLLIDFLEDWAHLQRSKSASK